MIGSFSREFLSENSRRKIDSLLPLVQHMYPNLSVVKHIVPSTASESVSFMCKDNGINVLQYSFWGDNEGNIYSITAYSNNVTLESLYRKYSYARNIFGFPIKSIEINRDDIPAFLDIMI